jgi:hypothetical protein
VIVESGNQIQDCRFAASGRSQDRVEGSIAKFEADLVENPEPLTVG